MSLDDRTVLEALATVRYPGFSRDVVSLGVVRGAQLEGGVVEIEITLGAGNPALAGPIERDVRAAVARLEGVREVRVRQHGRMAGSPALKMAAPARSVASAGALDARLIPGVRHAIAVASGKGGVGKSTIAVNLAVALAREGARVGLLDADVYGPSIPLMTGIDEPPRLAPDHRIVPFQRFGMRIMSLGFLVDRDSPVIWRGPMVMKALEQLLGDVTWGELDYLLVDMPPGTGDAQLTLSQKVRLAGAVIVTTPQDVALADARKGVAMFQKVGVPVLGIVENMSYFECPHCSGRSDIFGHGGGRAEAERLGIPCLGEVPLDAAIRAGGDTGQPVVNGDPSSPQARALIEVAARVRATLDESRSPGASASNGSVFDRWRPNRERPTD
jgi:ATP-binding protein involved in chromosome partitioning